MNDFVVAWRSMWIGFLGNDGTFSIYYDGSPVWSLNYIDIIGYALYVVLVIWLATLSIRILRKMLCGAFK